MGNLLEAVDTVVYFFLMLVLDEFLGRERFQEVYDAVSDAYASGHMRNAGAVRGGSVIAPVRGDSMMWVKPGYSAAIAGLVQSVMPIARERVESVGGVSVQAARYPPGARYLRHTDAQKDVGRKLTFIYYCNPDWQPEHEGQLKLYADDGTSLIDPVGDRLLVFDSTVPHEVLETKRERFAIVVWVY